MTTRTNDVWDFKKDASGSWTWQQQTMAHELLQEGRKPFAKLEDCIADARRFGYSGSFSVADDPRRDASGRLTRLTRR